MTYCNNQDAVVKANQPSWYVVYTYPNFEKKVSDLLHQRKIDVYLPMRKVTKQWSDRKKKVEIPLFPNYLFVRIPLNEKFTVLNTYGIVRFVSFEGRPAIIHDRDITFIQELLACGTDLAPNGIPSPVSMCIKKGERVRVLRGPFAGIEGMVIEQQGQKRLFIQLEAIEQSVSVDVSAYELEKVG